MKWQQLEEHVRMIAALKWQHEARAETINGVKVDCVVRVRADYWVLVEITQDTSLAKLRTDLAKFATVRPYLFAKQIYAEPYFVTQNAPPPSLFDSGAGQNVSVHSLAAFDALFFDFPSYRYARSQRRFGSAVDLVSGEKDPRAYVPVKYIDDTTKQSLSLDDLATALAKGSRIVLLGQYGTGKSRCIQELFECIVRRMTPSTILYPLAIDLRDNWGTKRGHEIVHRHFDDLGISSYSNQVMQILEKDSICLLLDGFDEIGSQAWSDNPKRLTKIREQSLLGVKDLISRTKSGIIITGREHYFNSNAEMFQCLGLTPRTAMLVRCADQFSDSEMLAYLKPIAPHIVLPAWVPRRPLVCQIMVGMSKDSLATLEDDSGSESAFWDRFIGALCDRESRIHAALEPHSIRRVLQRLARYTRQHQQNVGPIPISVINDTFEKITGLRPGDESAAMLQRLPALGRIGSESTDRQFVDEYILDGLRAEDVVELAVKDADNVINVKWSNPLRRFGLTLLAEWMSAAPSCSPFLSLMRQAAARQNAVLAGDILAAAMMASDSELDARGLLISDAHISILDFSMAPISNLTLSECIVDEVNIAEGVVNNVRIADCIIQQLNGVADAEGLPEWIRHNSVARYESVNTVARIRHASLSEEQRIFVTLVKKLFFQPGRGRKEEALLRGLGAAGNHKIANRLLKSLRSQGIIDKFKGEDGWVHTPTRKYAQRMQDILSQLTLSKDDLWTSLRKE